MMDEPSNGDEAASEVSISNESSACPPATRPTTLNILFDSNAKSQTLPSFRTPSLEELQPLLRSEIEKLIQQLKNSPQTPASFLNPNSVTEEQELFVNAFSKKLDELQDSGGITPLISTSENSSNSFIGLTGINSQSVPDFTELCRQAVQKQSQSIINPSILLYSPVGLTPNASAIAQLSHQLSNFDAQKANATGNCMPSNLHGQTSITVPSVSISIPPKETTTVQLANGLKFEIKANTVSQASVLKMLGLGQSQEVGAVSGSGTQSSQIDPLMWPLQVQNANSGDGVLATSSQSPHPDGNRPSSATNSFELTDSSLLQRPPSTVSSASSVSQSNIRDLPSGRTDICIDPTEQYRMRLERKRARNRDAARKCRERKIRLIKSLEKDVYYISEENKTLRYRISRSKAELERMKQFVISHIENKCPILNR